MNQYSLEIVKGTAEYVVKEIKEKFEDIHISCDSPTHISILSNIDAIDQFRVLLSPLRISNEVGIVRNLFRREWRTATSPAGINPSLAYIMNQITDIKSTDTVLDPFCGGGTIPITSYLYFSAKKVFGSDISGKAIDIVEKNLKNITYNKSDLIIFKSGVNNLKLRPNTIDKIVTNLPFGIRTGDHKKNVITYRNFVLKCEQLIKLNGKICILTQEKKLIREVFQNSTFKIINSIDIEQGGLTPSIFVYRK